MPISVFLEHSLPRSVSKFFRQARSVQKLLVPLYRFPLILNYDDFLLGLEPRFETIIGLRNNA